MLFFKDSTWHADYCAIEGVFDAAKALGVEVKIVEFGLSAEERGAVDFDRAFAEVVRASVARYRPDGAIVDQFLACRLRSVAPFGSLPVVLIDRSPKDFSGKVLCVYSDSAVLVREASRKLFAFKTETAAYVPWIDPQATWSAERGAEFRRLAEEDGRRYVEFEASEKSSLGRFGELCGWVGALPRPVVVFAANDQIGASVLAAAKNEGIQVPRELAVVSVDDNEGICERCEPTLSSIGQDFRSAGRIAVELLLQRIEGGIRAVRSRPFGVAKVECRASSSSVLAKSVRVGRMMEFIRRHATEGISTADVVATLDCSPQFASRIFRREIGHSILREIQMVQVEKIKMELKCKPDAKQEYIAFSAGFSSALDMRRVFKKITGGTIGKALLALALSLSGFASAAPKYDVVTESPIHVVHDRDEPIVITLRDDVAREWRGMVLAEDYYGNIVGTRVCASSASNETVEVKLPATRRYGAYVVKADFNGKFEAITRFGVLPKRMWTEPLAEGKFAMGAQVQLPWYTAEEQAKCLEAAKQMGLKVMRLRFCSFDRVCKESSTPDWSEADRYMSILETKGLRVDANIYWFPNWAQKDPNLRVTKEGTFRTFCRELAARYGTKIAWYEIGNEWDLSPAEKLPADEAIRIQREAYEGLKAGNPDVKVIPNGWAYVSTEASKTARAENPREWIHERVLSEAKDAYDYHAVHIHMEYEGYVLALRKLFAWRKELGVTKPWFPNETAQSCVFGRESIVARNVWRKILYSWAHGAISYNWYQMRAVNDDPNSAIGGYGLMSHEFYPRYTYAAFAALTRLFTNADFTASYADTLMRQILGFEIERAGKKEKIVVGWDAQIADDKPVTVAVASDAESVYAYDIMGNSERVKPGADGRYALPVSTTPHTLVFRGATKVEIDRDAALEGALAEDDIVGRQFIVAKPMALSGAGVHRLGGTFEHEDGFVAMLHIAGATMREMKLNGEVAQDLSKAKHGVNEIELTVEGESVTIEIEEASKVDAATPASFKEL